MLWLAALFALWFVAGLTIIVWRRVREASDAGKSRGQAALRGIASVFISAFVRFPV